MRTNLRADLEFGDQFLVRLFEALESGCPLQLLAQGGLSLPGSSVLPEELVQDRREGRVPPRCPDQPGRGLEGFESKLGKR